MQKFRLKLKRGREREGGREKEGKEREKGILHRTERRFTNIT
jgi:hypothetical protein